MRNLAKVLSLISVAFLSVTALASPTSSPLHVPNVADVGGDIAAHDEGALQNVMWMDTPNDPRDYISKKMRTDDAIKAFAITNDELALIKKTFGHLMCKWKGTNVYGGNSADLGAALDEIVVPLHSFYSRDMSTCYFLTYDRQKIKVIVSKEDRKQYADAEHAWSKTDDRIVLKLAKPVDGISKQDLLPYANPDFKLLKETKVLVISGYQEDWNKKRGLIASKMPEPLAYICEVKKTPVWPFNYVHTNCAADGGASGAKLLVRGANGKLIKTAMLIEIQAWDSDYKKFPNGSPFDPESMFTRGILIDSVFVGAEPNPKAEPTPKQSQSLAERCTEQKKSNASTQKQTALGQQTISVICSRALNCNQTAFDYSGVYNAEIEEARRRGFNVAKCKAVVSVN